MKNARRKFLSNAGLALGVASAGVVFSESATAQECNSVNCDPFPFVGEKGKYSMDEFNSVANNMAEQMIKNLEEGGVEVSAEQSEDIKNSTRQILKNMFSKYYVLG